KEGRARFRRDPVRIAAARIEVRDRRGARGLGGGLGEKVLDLERAETFVLLKLEDVHGTLLRSEVANGWSPTDSSGTATTHQQDDDHTENGEQRIADRVGHAVAQRRYLALCRFLNHSERGRGGTHPGAYAEKDRGMKLEDVAPQKDRDDERHGRGDDPPN